MIAPSPIARRDFLRMTGIAAGSLAITPVLAAAEGLSEVPRSRTDRLATGANVCQWFRFPRSNSAEHFTDYISAAEADYMSQIGLKHVRLCVAPRVIMNPASGDVIEERGKQLDSAIERFHRAGLAGRGRYPQRRPPRRTRSEVARGVRPLLGLAGRKIVPFRPRLDHPGNRQRTGVRPPRGGVERPQRPPGCRHPASAPGHTIITSGPNWGGIDGLKKLKLLPDGNVIYSFHCYDPFTFTHQGATWAGPAVRPLHDVPYPSSPEAVEPLLAALESSPDSKRMVESYGKERWDKEKLAARFRQGIEWGVRNRVPLYCGEFGVFPAHSKPEDRSRWFRDFGEVLAENRIGWAVWGWDEGFGLNRRMVNGKPVVDAMVAQSLGLKVR